MISRRALALGIGILRIGQGIAGCSSPTSSNAIDEYRMKVRKNEHSMRKKPL